MQYSPGLRNYGIELSGPGWVFADTTTRGGAPFIVSPKVDTTTGCNFALFTRTMQRIIVHISHATSLLDSRASVYANPGEWKDSDLSGP